MAKKTSTPTTASNVVSIAAAREPRAVAAGKAYSYPKALLWQDYFCKCGDGRILPPSFDLKMLADTNWRSPLAALLEELRLDGHDVRAALIEYRAFLEGVRAFDHEIDQMRLRWSRDCPTLVKHMLESM